MSTGGRYIISYIYILSWHIGVPLQYYYLLPRYRYLQGRFDGFSIVVLKAFSDHATPVQEQGDQDFGGFHVIVPL